MESYDSLVKALICGEYPEMSCLRCSYGSPVYCDRDKIMRDAAAAIEDLEGFLAEAERDRDEYMERMEKEQKRVLELQAKLERLKECLDELREAQTYIDHYGDKWMTSAKDVPTSAYNHGYMDGKNEAEQALEPKRGEWIEIRGGFGLRCSACGGDALCNGIEEDVPSKYCPNCGAKMEVQDG